MLLLTWWTGYIWSHAAVVLIEAGYDIVILDNLSNSSRDVLDSIKTITWKKPVFYEADLRDKESIKKVFHENKINWVIHFAGLKAVWESCDKPYEYYENNVVGSNNLFEVMEEYNCKNIIFSSSATVYDPYQIPPFTEDTITWNTTNPYGTSKLIIENMLRDLANHRGFKVANLRYFNPVWAHESGLIGEDPNDIPNNLLPYIMKVASGELSELSVFWDDYETIDGTWVRDYIHVVDLVEAHLSAWKWLETIEKPIFEPINLWTGAGTSVFEMIIITEEIIWRRLPYKITPRRNWDIASAYCNPEKAKKLLWWEANMTVEEAVRDSWNFIQNNKK